MSNRKKFWQALPQPFGAANWVTTLRAGFALTLLAYGALSAWEGIGPTSLLRWYWVIGALVVLGLDGVDGLIARRLGQASRFGARFDMETDAAVILGLALLVVISGQAGGWVLASGGLRYIFMAGAWLWPVLAAPLPPRRRRQAICVVQTLALIIAGAPSVVPPAAALICAVALGVLGCSFAIDIAWLIANRVDASESEALI